MVAEPAYDLSGAFVGREDGIEDVFDVAIANDQGEALEEAHAGDVEGRQMEGVGEFEGGIAENFEGKIEARRHFALIAGGLGAKAEDFGFELRQFPIMIAKAAGLGSAAAGTGDIVPVVGQRLAWDAGHWVAVDHGPGSGELRKADGASRC